MKKNKFTLLLAIVLLIIAAYFVITNSKGTIRKELRDFAVADTASINKVFLADKMGGRAIVERKGAGIWVVNEKYPARPDAVNHLLETIKDIEVRSPVAKAAYNNVMKELAAVATKVEIYQQDKLVKTYYVGGATDDQLGTYMYIENSSVPFVLHIPGFNGYLTPRYISSETDWKSKTIFDYKMNQIASFTFEDLKNPQNSFSIIKAADSKFDLLTYPAKEPVPGVEENKLQNYLSNFEFINCEGISYNSRHEQDSIRRAGPFLAFTLTDIQNKTTKISFFRLPITETSKQFYDQSTGKDLTFDHDRMLALVNNDPDFIVVQYYTFGKFFTTINNFKIQPVEKTRK